MSSPTEDPRALLDRCLETGRLHSAYLVSGAGPEPREAALAFARGIVCTGTAPGPCEECRECQRSREPEETLHLDGTGKQGPLLRHVGDHPDLLWIERGDSDTRVRIGQVRALQQKLRLRGEGEGRRAGVIADAEWLNAEAQNALLHLLEEPPPRTTLVLVAASPTSLLATVRSRCQRVPFRSAAPDPLADPERQELVARLEAMGRTSVPELLGWAEEYKGARAVAALEVHTLIETGSAWLRGRVRQRVARGIGVSGDLDADRELAACRRTLDQRNANPQMVAERALVALREAANR